MMRQELDQAARFRALAPRVGLGDSFSVIAFGQFQKRQFFVWAISAAEERHAKIVMMDAGMMKLEVFRRSLIKVCSTFPVALSFCDIAAQQVIRKEEKRDVR